MNDYQKDLMYKDYKSKINIEKKSSDNFYNKYEHKTSINELSDEDDRLLYVLITLGLGQIFHIFNEKNLSFTDLLLLSKESLKEFGLEMYQRNRIYNFSTSFNRNAKTYSIKEISDFFTENKQFLFSPSIYNKLMQVKNNLDYNSIKNSKIKKFSNENKYFSDDEDKFYNKERYNRDMLTNRIKNRKSSLGTGAKSYKASKIFKKYLLIKKGVDEFLNKLNKQKEDTENISYKYSNLFKKINNSNDFFNIISNIDKNSSSKRIFNNYNINDDNEDTSLNYLNENLNTQKTKNDEYNKLLEKIGKLEQKKNDEKITEHLNQRKNYIKEKGLNLNIDEIISFQNELDKITEVINKKEKLKQNLEKHNRNIEENTKLIINFDKEYNGINYDKIGENKNIKNI